MKYLTPFSKARESVRIFSRLRFRLILSRTKKERATVSTNTAQPTHATGFDPARSPPVAQ
ncbi:hypothetical protein Mapa_003702 [Marchantia paleacea]|nr:hypothetical protein Mapa_003702 [Marchantia paleacea]